MSNNQLPSRASHAAHCHENCRSRPLHSSSIDTGYRGLRHARETYPEALSEASRLAYMAGHLIAHKIVAEKST